MKTRGRKRSRNTVLPNGILWDKLPDGIYWDASGRGHWYIKYYDATGKRRRKRVAGPQAKLSDLHKIIEQENGIDRNTFAYIAEQFAASVDYQHLAAGTRKNYEYCLRVVQETPTKLGVKLDKAPLGKWTRVQVRKFVDHLERTRGPSAANHTLRYVRRVFSWAAERIEGLENPARGVKAVQEVKKRGCPSEATYQAVRAFASTREPYLWIVMELAYLLRLRGIEVLTLTDAHETPERVMVQRTKGSRGNLTRWSPRLRAAWDAAKALRQQIRGKRGLSTPLQPGERWLFLSPDGQHLRRSTLDTAWQRMITKAIEKGKIQPEDRFSLHDLKRRGITNTKGTRADKREASGHRSDSMMDVYDQSVPEVEATE